MTGKSTSSISKSNKKTPLWEKSNLGINDLCTFVEIPIKYEHKITPTFSISKNPNAKPIANQQIIDASFDRLIIYKDKNGKINELIISFVPDEDYLRKHKGDISHNKIDKLDEDFFGYLHYKDWDGKVLFVLRIEKGKPVKKYDMLKSITGKISIVNNSKINGDKVMVVDDGGEKCYFMTWAWYQDCFEISPELMYCDEPVIYNIQYIEIPCQPPGGGGGDPDPCLNVARFASGDCPEDEEEPIPVDTIINVKDSCLKALVSSILSSNIKSDFNILMQDFLIGDDHLVITFVDEDFGDENSAGDMPQLLPKVIDGENYLLGNLYLNTRVLVGASEEYKTAVIYHEILHAYFHTLGGLYNGINHSVMSSSYVSMLQNALQTRFPNLSNPDASALAWSGLHGTAMWELRPNPTQINYSNIEYSYTKHGTKGTKCN